MRYMVTYSLTLLAIIDFSYDHKSFSLHPSLLYFSYIFVFHSSHFPLCSDLIQSFLYSFFNRLYWMWTHDSVNWMYPLVMLIVSLMHYLHTCRCMDLFIAWKSCCNFLWLKLQIYVYEPIPAFTLGLFSIALHVWP